MEMLVVNLGGAVSTYSTLARDPMDPSGSSSIRRWSCARLTWGYEKMPRSTAHETWFEVNVMYAACVCFNEYAVRTT